MTLRGIAESIGAVVLVASAVTAAVERQAAYREHLAGLNVAAVADSTHHADVGNLEIARRQAEQLQVKLDAKTHEANDKGVALANLAIRFHDLQATTTGTVTRDTARDTTTAGFVVEGRLDARDSAGVDVRARVVATFIPSPRAVWSWNLERQPIPLTVDFACHRDTAVVHVAGPPWAHSSIDRAEQDPTFCNPPPRWNPFAIQVPSLPVAASLFALGWLLHR